MLTLQRESTSASTIQAVSMPPWPNFQDCVLVLQGRVQAVTQISSRSLGEIYNHRSTESLADVEHPIPNRLRPEVFDDIRRLSLLAVSLLHPHHLPRNAGDLVAVIANVFLVCLAHLQCLEADPAELVDRFFHSCDEELARRMVCRGQKDI